MSQKISPTVDRQVRIELLRARAAVEREALVHYSADVAESLSPSRLIKGLVPQMSAGNMPMMAWRVFSMVRRYPVIMSTVSAVFLRGKRSRLLKLATAAVVGWQAYRGWQARRGDDSGHSGAGHTAPAGSASAGHIPQQHMAPSAGMDPVARGGAINPAAPTSRPPSL